MPVMVAIRMEQPRDVIFIVVFSLALGSLARKTVAPFIGKLGQRVIKIKTFLLPK